MCAPGTQRLDKAGVQLRMNFLAWRACANECEELDIASVVDALCTMALPPAERRAYDAPFPDESYKAGARKVSLCVLVPIAADDPAIAANEATWRVLRRWPRPFLTVWGRKDPLMGTDEYYEARAPRGCRTRSCRMRATSYRRTQAPSLSATSPQSSDCLLHDCAQAPQAQTRHAMHLSCWSVWPSD